MLDDTGNIYTTQGCVIAKWTKSTNTWSHIAGKEGDCFSQGALQTATSFAIDSLGYIYVAEVQGHRISKWYNGVRVAILNNNVGTPVKLCLDKSNNLYILDAAGNAVYKLPPGKSKYTVVAGGNGAGSALNQFNNPTCMTIDEEGSLYIGDPANNRVTRWTPGATQGVVVAGGGPNSGTIYDIHPKDIEIDASHNLFLLETGNDEVIYWPAGSSFGIYTGRIYTIADELDVNYRIALDKNRNLYSVLNGYGYEFPRSGVLNKSYLSASYTVSADYTVRSSYSNGCTATSAVTHLIDAPYQPLIQGQYGGICHLTLPYYNYYSPDPTHPSLVWTAPKGATILSGQGTDSIVVKFDSAFTKGTINFTTSNACTSYSDAYPVLAAPVAGYIGGYKKVSANQKKVRYTIYPPEEGSTYTWSVPAGAVITDGQGTDTIYVNFGTTSGKIGVVTTDACGSATSSPLKVTVSSSADVDKEAALPAPTTAGTISNPVIYPQPASGTATLRFASAKSEMVSLSIRDLYGKTVYTAGIRTTAGINTCTLPVSTLRSGTYFVSLYSPTVNAKGIKLVVIQP